MQSLSSRIWTRVAVSISYDDNHFTTGNFLQHIRPKEYAIERLDFEHAYYHIKIQHVNQYATRTPTQEVSVVS